MARFHPSVLALWALLVTLPTVGQDFSSPKHLATSEAETARSLTLGDLDADGDIDVVVGVDTHVGIYFNDGTGNFGPQVRLGGTNRAYEISVVDVDDDGLVDITWANWLDPIIAWSQNLGSGNFAPPAALVVTAFGAQNATSIDWADVDGDGRTDLFTSSYGQGTSSWFKNLGNATFGPRQTLNPTASAWTCAVADLDGDGSLDGVVGGTSLVWARSQNGDFSILQPLNALIGGTAGVRDLVAANIDGDPATEFFTAEPSINKIARFDFTSLTQPFTNSTISTTAAGVTHLSISDVNGDGNLDLLASCTGDHSVRVFYNCGPFPVVLFTDLYGVLASEAADLDQDGLPDVVTLSALSDEVAVHRQVAPGIFAPKVLLTPLGGGLTEVLGTDLDGDGLTDVVFMYSGSHHLVWKRNEGDDLFGPLRIIDGQLTDVSKVLASDQDGDGDMDLVVSVAGVGIHWYRNNGAGVFSPRLVISSTVGPGDAFELTDMDTDGDMDLIAHAGTAANSYAFVSFANVGDGNMEPPVTLLTGMTNLTQLLLTDVDSDDDLDFVYLRSSNIQYSLNNGDWTLTPPVVVTTGFAFNRIHAADLNADGNMDLIAHFTGSELMVFWGIGGGSFDAGQVLAAGAFQSVRLADIDLDGDMDLICGMTDGRAQWLKNDGAGDFAEVSFTLPIYGRAEHLDLVDLDGDTDLDLLVGSDHDDIAWFESFVGSPYGMEGHVYIDRDFDATFSTGDIVFPYIAMDCAPSASMAFSTTEGYYRFGTDPGTYTVSPLGIESFWIPVADQAERTVTLDDGLPFATGVDFGRVALLDTLALHWSSTSANVRCGQPYLRWIDVVNRGTVTASMEVLLQLDPNDSILQAEPPPTTNADGILTWMVQLPPLSELRIDLVGESLALFGTVLSDSVTVRAQGAVGSISSLDETTHYLRTVICSYDPNDKQVFPEGLGPDHAIDIATDELRYSIRFQNTGNAPAFDVRLHDRLHPLLDPQSIRVLGTSHPITGLQWNANDGELVVRYDDIMLPDSTTDLLGSQGYFTFSIGLLAPPASGTVITNSVDIYFDINPPVLTNTVWSTFIDCALAQATIIELSSGHLLAMGTGTYAWYRDGILLPDEVESVLQATEAGSYTVQITDQNGCEPISAPIEVVPTAVQQLEAPSFAIVPNPSSGLIRVHGPAAGGTFELHDVHGRLVHSFQAAQGPYTEVDLRAYPAGIYLLRWTGAGSFRKSVRLVLE